MSARRAALALQLATLAALAVAWEGLALSGLVWHGVVPGLGAVAAALLSLPGSAAFWHGLLLTAGEVGAAMVLGGLPGLLCGLVLGSSRFAGRAFEPLLHYLAPTPKIVFLPVVLILAGIGPSSKVVLGALSCFFPMALSVAVGVRGVDRGLLRVAASLRMSRLQRLRLVMLPALVPTLRTALRLSFGLALVGCLLAELSLSNAGLGFLAMEAYGQLAMPRMYAVLVCIFALAAAGNVVIGAVRPPVRR